MKARRGSTWSAWLAVIGALALLALALTGCELLQGDEGTPLPPATAVRTATAVVTATRPVTATVAVTATRPVTATVAVTATKPATATVAVTATKPAAATPVVTATKAITPTAYPASKATVRPSVAPAMGAGLRVKIALIALNDGGKAGKAVGCGDSVVLVERTLPSTAGVLRAALQELLAQRDRLYGQSGLYNALYQSDLRVDSVAVIAGKATIRLSGRLQLSGTCDNPRVEAQIAETARQFATVQQVEVFLNGKPLSQALSLK